MESNKYNGKVGLIHFYHYNKNVDFELIINSKKLKKNITDDIMAKIIDVLEDITDDIDNKKSDEINHIDNITKWIEENLEKTDNYKVDKIKCSDLYELFSDEIKDVSKQKFNKYMINKGFIRNKVGGVYNWRYIKPTFGY